MCSIFECYFGCKTKNMGTDMKLQDPVYFIFGIFGFICYYFSYGAISLSTILFIPLYIHVYVNIISWKLSQMPFIINDSIQLCDVNQI